MHKTKVLLREYKDHRKNWGILPSCEPQADEIWDLILNHLSGDNYKYVHHIVSSEYVPGEIVSWSPMNTTERTIIVERGTLKYWLSIYYE